MQPINEYLSIESNRIRCRCGQDLCAATENYKLHVASAERDLTAAGPLVTPHIHTGQFVLREFYCPNCYTMLDVEVMLKGQPPVWEAQLATGA